MMKAGPGAVASDQVEPVGRVGEADVAQDDVGRLLLDEGAGRRHVAGGPHDR